MGLEKILNCRYSKRLGTIEKINEVKK